MFANMKFLPACLTLLAEDNVSIIELCLEAAEETYSYRNISYYTVLRIYINGLVFLGGVESEHVDRADDLRASKFHEKSSVIDGICGLVLRRD